MSSSLRTPLGRVRGLGSAKTGTEDHIASRVSSIALAPLSCWFAISAATSLDGTYENALAWAAHPVNAVLLFLFVVASLYHMGLGMRVIVEDYIHKHGTKHVLLILNSFAWMALAVVAAFALIRLSLGGL